MIVAQNPYDTLSSPESSKPSKDRFYFFIYFYDPSPTLTHKLIILQFYYTSFC